MLELLDRAETIEAIRQGLEAARQGDTMTVENFDKKIRNKFSIPERK
jgi:hypothetical protein